MVARCLSLPRSSLQRFGMGRALHWPTWRRTLIPTALPKRPSQTCVVRRCGRCWLGNLFQRQPQTFCPSSELLRRSKCRPKSKRQSHPENKGRSKQHAGQRKSIGSCRHFGLYFEPMQKKRPGWGAFLVDETLGEMRCLLRRHRRFGQVAQHVVQHAAVLRRSRSRWRYRCGREVRFPWSCRRSDRSMVAFTSCAAEFAVRARLDRLTISSPVSRGSCGCRRR